MKGYLLNFSGIYNNQKFWKENNLITYNMEDIRGTDCYCDDLAQEEIAKRLENCDVRAVHFIDSGNYHYMSKIFLDNINEVVKLVVLDNHPDMKMPAFGNILSCGGWIKEVLDNNKLVEKVYLIGVKKELIEELNEEISSYINEDKLEIISQKDIDGIDIKNEKIYLSVDKDVLLKDEIDTNWDQGDMSLETMKVLLGKIYSNNEVIGVDVCGEQSKQEENEENMLKSDEINRIILEILR